MSHLSQKQLPSLSVLAINELHARRYLCPCAQETEMSLFFQRLIEILNRLCTREPRGLSGASEADLWSVENWK